MKRDMELIRNLLLVVKLSDWPPRGNQPVIDGQTKEEVAYHLELMPEAGLVSAIDPSSNDGRCYGAVSLTWIGHDFLDAAREDSR